MQKIKKHNFLFFLTLSFILFLILEIGSFFILNFIQNLEEKWMAKSSSLYKQIDPDDTTNWIMTPNFNMSFGELIKEKEMENKWFSVKMIKEWMSTYNFSSNQTALYINSYGFRGPEIKKDKDDKTRIISVGNSITLGPFGQFSYPITIEEELIKKDYNIEVLNAGVEGYQVKNIIKRINYISEFNPDIITLYIGWNDIYDDREGLTISFLDEFFHRLNFLKLSRKINDLIMKFNNKIPSYSIPGSTENKIYKKINLEYNPTFLKDLSMLIDGLRSKNPKLKIIIFTLPSLFDPYEIPDMETLKIGHMPLFTNNAYVLSYMTYKYNEDIRILSKEKNCFLIDIENYADQKLIPKKNYFFDSVHLTPEAHILIGKYIVDILTEENNLL